MSSGPAATLKRSLGLTTLTLYGLGNILGAGIYVLVGSMAAHAGMLTPFAFIVAGRAARDTAIRSGSPWSGCSVASHWAWHRP